MTFRLITIMLFVWAQSAFAQALSPSECAEILSTYQITPPQCAKATDATKPAPQRNGPSGALSKNNVFFAKGGKQLDQAAQKQIQQLAGVLNTPLMQNACLRLVGHSDSSGSAEINKSVGLDRAATVRDALAELIQRPGRIEDIQSRGEEAPLAEFAPSSKWQRRVEIWARPCGTLLGQLN